MQHQGFLDFGPVAGRKRAEGVVHGQAPPQTVAPVCSAGMSASKRSLIVAGWGGSATYSAASWAAMANSRCRSQASAPDSEAEECPTNPAAA
jgi:hypothetical protein